MPMGRRPYRRKNASRRQQSEVFLHGFPPFSALIVPFKSQGLSDSRPSNPDLTDAFEIFFLPMTISDGEALEDMITVFM